MSKAEDLANFISIERQMDIESEFYEEVTKAEFDAWYAKSGTKKQASKAGFTIYDQENMARYYLISKKKAMKGGMTKQAMLAYRLMWYSKGSTVYVMKDGSGALVRMTYEHTPQTFRNSNYVEMFGDTKEERSYVLGSGRKSRLDKLILNSIHKWADAKNINVRMIALTHGKGNDQ